MPKSGEFRTGEAQTGDVPPTIVSPPAQTFGIRHLSPDISGSGAVALSPNVQTFGLGLNGEIPVRSAKSGEQRTGHLPSGGQARAGLTVEQTLVLRPPAQTLGIRHLPPDIAGTGAATIQPDAQTFGLSWRDPQIGYEEWVLDDDGLELVTAETATDRTLAVTVRATSDLLRNVLRPLKTDEGKVTIHGTDDGGFRAVDRANGGNTFDLIPPVRRLPLRQSGDVHVQRYEETLVSQDVGEWDVSVEFARSRDRTDSPSLSQSPDADEWGFTTRHGTIATERVDADFLGLGEGGVERFRIVSRFTFDQAHVWEAAYPRLGGGRVRTIPDAPNVAVDDTTDDAVTLTVDAPDDQDEVADGDYIVFEWESTRLTDAYQEVEFVIAST